MTAKPKDAVDFALGHIRASGGVVYSREAFQQSIATGVVSAGVENAIETHLYEAETAELADLVAQRFTSFALLARLARRILPETHVNRVYLEAAVS